MQKHVILFLLVISIGAIVVAGCTSTGSTNATGQSTTASTPNVTIQVTPTIQATIPITTVTTVNETPEVIPPYSSDISKITFARYTDSDFSVDYPSDWNVSKSIYSAYYCMNDENPTTPGYTSSNFSNWCYNNDTQAIGPFDFYSSYSDPTIQKTSRVVTFTSPDETLKFSSFTNDFTPNVIGDYILNPTADWINAQFALEYPDLSPSLYVANYNYFEKSGGLKVATYDVTMPEGSKYYPLTYTKEVAVSQHHEYEFAFIDSNENSSSYSSLDSRIISSITENDTA